MVIKRWVFTNDQLKLHDGKSSVLCKGGCSVCLIGMSIDTLTKYKLHEIMKTCVKTLSIQMMIS